MRGACTIVASTLIALIVGGCASAPAPPPPTDLMAGPPIEVRDRFDELFLPGAALLDGWDFGAPETITAPDTPPPAGQRLLLGIHVETDDVVKTRYVLYESLDATGGETNIWMSDDPFAGVERTFSSRPAKLKLTIYDEQLEQIGELDEQPAALLLRTGLGALNTLGLALREDTNDAPLASGARDELSRAATLSLLALVEFSQFVRNTRPLRRTMMPVVSLPPVLGLVFGDRSIGISIIDEQLRPPAPIARGGIDLGISHVIPMRLKIGSHTAMFGRLTATDPVGPLALTGGVLEMMATHPTEPNRRLVMRVIAVDGIDETEPTPLSSR